MSRQVPSPPAVAVAAATLVASFVAVRRGRGRRFDAWLDRFRVPLGRHVDRSVAAATDLGSVFGIVGTAVLLAGAGRRTAALDVAGAGATAWALAQAVKPLADRQRPFELEDAGSAVARLVAIPAGSSWPSGHSAVAAAMGSTVAAHTASARTGALVGGTFASFVAVSRIYVGVHHGSDVVAGVSVGVLSAALWRRLRRVVASRLGRR